MRETIKEEHIVLVQEPGSIYRDHITPVSGKAKDIAKNIYQFLKNTGPVNTITVIVANGTAVNTGKENEAIVLLEKELEVHCSG